MNNSPMYIGHKLLWTGLTVLLAWPAVLSGDILLMLGGLLMIIGAVLVWINR